MRVRRTILAPVILTIGALGSVVTGPVLALTAGAAQAAPVAATKPGVVVYHA